MKRSTMLVLALVCGMMSAIKVQADEWIDLTEQFVKNPNYDGNDYSYWIGTELNGYNPKDNAEHYERTYDTYQVITGLTPGKYRVGLKAFYRYGSASKDYDAYNDGSYSANPVSMLYAKSSEGDFTSPIAQLASGARDESLGGGTADVGGPLWSGNPTYKVPNNMEAAYYWFEAGYYQNYVECTVGDNGELQIGIRKFDWIGEDWTCIDTWTLEYWGTPVKAQQVKFDKTTLNLAIGDKVQITATVIPVSTTIKKLAWTSSNEKVAIVDQNGLVETIDGGTAIITAKTTDGSNRSAICRVVVESNGATGDDICINEIMVANVDMFIDPSFNYGGFVELYNNTDKSVTISKYYISDDPDNLKKFRFPARYGAVAGHSYLTIWFDNHSRYAPNQVDFSLDTDGGTIYLSDSEGNLILQQDYPEAVARCSYSRLTDNGNEWGMTSKPTPGASNNGTVAEIGRLDAPVVDKPGQIFSGMILVTVNIPQGATLRYTDDGSTPTLENGTVSRTGIFRIDETRTYRFRLFKDGMMPSEVVTYTYILDNGYTLPIISVAGNYEDLYGDDYGIFVRGNGNGLVGNGQSSPCNWNTDWEHPVNFEYLLDGSTVFSQEASIKSAGGWSRAWNPHSFKIKAGKVYEGRKYLDYPFFVDKPYLRHKVLQIRNGGNDNDARIIDPSVQEIIRRSGVNVDNQCYQPTQHFINGSYIGVINMREPNNKHFAVANWNYDTEEVDQFEMSPDSGYVQKAGDAEAFNRLYTLSYHASEEASYDEIRNLLDIDEFINYCAIQLYLGGTDFPQNNVKAYRPRVENGKFRFVLFDLDFAFNTSDPFSNFFNKQYHTFDNLYDTTDALAAGKTIQNNRVVEEIKVVTIFKNLLNNDSFRKQFIDSYCLVGGSIFTPERCTEIVDELVARVDNAMAMEGRQWNLYNSSNKVKNGFTAARQLSMVNTMKSNYDSYFHLGSVERQKVSLTSNIDEARLFVNDIPVPTNKFNGYLFAPVTLRASAPAGYQFLGWQSDAGSVGETKTFFSWGSQWSYYDQGSLDNQGWPSVSVANWNKGYAPMGYYTSDSNNSRGYKTYLEWGTDANNKRPTYYFYRTQYLNVEPDGSYVFTLNFRCDDGFIIYVNGQEAGRYNMPSGTVRYNTYSTQYAPGNPDSGSILLSPDLFKKGYNSFSVEVHNCDNHSTDIYWDAEVVYQVVSTGQNIISAEEEFEMPATGTLNLTAMYVKADPEEVVGNDVHDVRINEISASNSIYVNEYFKRNDWIELYNTTDHDIDVAGYYITDNLDKPTKYQIEAASTIDQTYSTVIPAHGFLVIWADKLDSQSQLHTTFKLDAEGGSVMLMAPDQSWRDTLNYVAHNGDQTVGVYPDGGSKMYVMTIPTIGESNRMNSYTMEFEEPNIPGEDPNAIADTEINLNGGLSLAFTGDALVIRSDDPTLCSVEVFSASGQKVMSTKTNVADQSSVGVAMLPAGIYVARVKNAEDDICRIKFVIR